MTLFMVVAAVWGVLQFATVGWFAGRSVRVGTALLAIPVGLYACGAIALLLQILYTRVNAGISGTSLSEVVRTASYTVDPVIEELVKIAPLLLIGLVLRNRFQWGLTDYMVLGAGLGAGFGLLEAVLRFSHRTNISIPTHSGWLIATGLSPTFIPDVGTTLTSWLPAPVTSEFLSFSPSPETFMHLAWTATAGLGVGLLVRGRGAIRLLGILPILWVSGEHAATNYDVSLSHDNDLAHVLASPFLAVHSLLWLYPLLGLGIAAAFDLRDVARGQTALPDTRFGPPQGFQGAAIGQFAMLRLPWTALVALRFVRARRALLYAHARAPVAPDDPWRQAVREVRDQMSRAGTAEAWRDAPPLRTALRPMLAASSGGPSRILRYRRVLVWLLLLVPSMVFFVIGDFRLTGFLQDALTSSAGSVVLIVFLLAGLGWLAWQLILTLRGLPAALRLPYIEPAVRSGFRLLSGAGAAFAGVTALILYLTGTPLDSRAIANYHVLDALAGAIAAVLLLLALAALITMFPPGALVLVGGEVLVGGTISASTIAGTAVIGGISGMLLAQASDGGSSSEGGSSEGGSSDSAGSGKPANNADNFPADNFENTEYSVDELSSMTYRHTGSGEMHIGGNAPRPTEAEILDTLKQGKATPLDGQNAVKYVRNGIKIIVNRDMPWQSTAYYIGG
jgi:hypothetical protein